MPSLSFPGRLNSPFMHTKMHYHSNVLLVVNVSGQIRLLYTPFRVLCIVASGRIPLNTWVYVEEIWSNDRDELQYLIFNQAHSYKFFCLPIKF
jgi:hypothetical protein